MAPRIPAVRARFGPVEFYAQRAGAPLQRRLQAYSRPWASGAELEDTGRDARQFPVSAMLTKAQVDELEALSEAAKPRTYRDPTRGSFTCHLDSLTPNWDAKLLNFYQVELNFTVAGEAARPAPSLSTSSAKKKARDQADPFAGGLDGLDDIPGLNMPADADSRRQAFTDAWGSFDAAMDGDAGGLSDSGGGQGLRGLFGGLKDAVQDVAEMAEEAVSGVTDLAGDVVDGVLELREQGSALLASCLDVVSSLEESADGWMQVLVQTPQALTTMLQLEYGAPPPPALVDAVYGRFNGDTPLDPIYMSAGVELEIPTTLEGFLDAIV